MSDTLTMTDAEILDQIKSETAENRVFLYLKGTPDMPRCGFSNQVVQILNITGAEFGSRDVLDRPAYPRGAVGVVGLADHPAALRRRQARRRVRHHDRDVPERRAPGAPRHQVAGGSGRSTWSAVFAPDEPLAELHAHLGGGVDAATMWELAHEQGIKLPFDDYWAFARAASVGAGVAGLDGLDAIYHLTELIQSSPEGVFRSVHTMLGRRLPVAADHDARGAVQPRQTQPRRRARPRRDRDGRRARGGSGDARVPDPGERDADDGSLLHARAQRGDRRAGDQVRRPGRGRDRHRRPATRRDRRCRSTTRASRRSSTARGPPGSG